MIDLRPHNDPARLTDEAEDWAAECFQLREENARLREELRKIERVARGSAEIMRDQKRTGRWEGAERTANAFERLSKDASQALNKEPTL